MVLTTADEPIKEVKTGGSLGCSDHTLVEFVISRSVSLVRSKVKTLYFARENFQLFKELVNEITWVTALMDRGVDQSSQLFKATMPKSARTPYPSLYEIEQGRLDTGMTEQGSLPQTKDLEGNEQPGGTGTYDLGRVQGQGLDEQERVKES